MLADDEHVIARRVVVAIGVEHFAYVPKSLSELPAELCTHSSAHTDLSAFRGKEVVVIGAGQSALESAALLHENGANVQLLARRRVIAWNGEPLPLDRSLPQRLREPEAGLGSGWATWFYSNHPDLFRQSAGTLGYTERERRWGQPVLAGSAAGWMGSSPSWPAMP